MEGQVLCDQVDGDHDRLKDRAGCRHDHDHKYEERFGVVARLGVGERLISTGGNRHDDQKHKGPKAEDDLDFAEQVKQAGVAGIAVGEPLELFDREGVDQRQCKDDGGCDVEGMGDAGLHGRAGSCVAARPAR